MKANSKRVIRLLAGFLFAAVLVTGSLAAVSTEAKAAGNEAADYYYQELQSSELAQRFYRVFEDMAEQGLFKDGKTGYDLLGQGVLTETDIKAYAESKVPTVPVALAAARDAFYMDHPDLFYVDTYKMLLTAGTKSDGKYVAYIDAGDVDNYYVDGTVKNATEVDAAVAEYEAALNTIVNDAKAASADVVGQIKYVNNVFCQNVQYDYGAITGVDEYNFDGYVNTAYGSLVEKKALCGGFSRGFKAVMDRLGIPCVLVQGTTYGMSQATGMKPGYASHMWNAVKVDGLWYAVDVAWNATGLVSERYLLVGEDTLGTNHYVDGVISSSGFELKYPALRPLNYDQTVDSAGFEFKDSGTVNNTEFGYVESGGRTFLALGIRYEGLNSKQLRAQGKYLAVRYITDNAVGVWQAISPDLGENIVGPYLYMDFNSYVDQVQFAVIDYAPDRGLMGDTTPPLVLYADLTDDHILAISTKYTNEAYGSYVAAPRVKNCTPSPTSVIEKFDAVEVSLEYNEELLDEDGNAIGANTEIRIEVYGKKGDMTAATIVENVGYNAANKTLSFTFTPSPNYADNFETYSFIPVNLVGKSSFEKQGKAGAKTPEAGGFLTFKRKTFVCPKVFNDGRLYMQVYGQPQFVDNKDLSLNGFKDEKGQLCTERQRSQLMLVVNSPNKKEQEKLDQALYEKTALQEEDVIESATYQIDLQMCGLVQQVPKGSYMQVGFGFPEGYGPNDAGTTFTVYHYTYKADGVTIDTVEEVPCVITQYGIIATVNSFSPFTVCVVDKSKVTTRNIYAAVNGVGGKIDRTKVETVAAGGSVTYTLTADAGYSIGEVTLNGNAVTPTASGNGVWTVTVGYNDMAANNTVEASFISDRAAAFYAEQGITVVRPKLIVAQSDLITAVAHSDAAPTDPKKTNVAAIVLSVILAVVLVAAGAVIAYLVIRLKKNGGNGGTPAKKTEKPAAKPATSSTAQTSKPVQASKPTQTSAQRPAQTSAQRSAQPTARPTQSAARPAQRPPQNSRDKK